MIDLDKSYNKYAKDVVEGRVVACQCIKLACQRYLDWFERDDVYFDYEDVDKKIRFISLLKHSTGQHNKQPFILLPWQSWVVANVFGFKWKETGLRVINNVFIMISRKNGKTALAAALCLACAIADSENNAEIELVANSRQQANIAFEMCYNYAESVDPKKRKIKIKRSSIEIPKTKSSIRVLSSDAMGNDGYNSSCFVLDEFHAARDWSLYNVMKSSQGMRQQPLGIVITTAGFLLSGYPCYEYRRTCIDILKGIKEDDTQFAAIYELDEDDDWQDESVWLKCSPSLGQTVQYKYMQDQVKSAVNTPMLEVGVKTKIFNMFCQSKTVWIPDRFISKSLARVDIADFRDEESFIGVDLSVNSDMTAFSVMFPPNPSRKKWPDKYVFKTYVYLPECAFEESMNAVLYKQWYRNKYLKVTPGDIINYDYILKDQLELYKETYLVAVAYDPFNARKWVNDAESEGLPMYEYSQRLVNFNIPSKEFERLVRSGGVVIDDNPIVEWAFANVELIVDAQENIKPAKAGKDPNRKIDPVIAMMEALGSYLIKYKYTDDTVLSV